MESPWNILYPKGVHINHSFGNHWLRAMKVYSVFWKYYDIWSYDDSAATFPEVFHLVCQIMTEIVKAHYILMDLI